MSNKSRDSREADIGFCKPPVATQFKTGTSGNPRGRPKGSRNSSSVLQKALHEKIVINENGKRKTISKLEAAMKQLTNKAASGDMAAVKFLILFLQTWEKQNEDGDAAQVALTEDDKQIMERMLKRLASSMQGEAPHEKA